MKRSIALAVFSLLVTLPLVADTIRVPTDQATIQAAVDAAQPDDVILLAPGDYNETVDIDSKTSITIRGKKKASVLGTGSGVVITVQNSTGITIDGILVDDGDTGIAVTGSTTVIIQRCMITGLADEGVLVENSTGVIVQKCAFVLLPGNGVDMSDSGGGPASDSTVAKNIFSLVTGSNVIVDGTGNVVEKNKSANTGGISILSTGTTNTVQKNKMAAVTGNGIDISGDSNTIFKNKLIVTTGDGIDVSGDDNLVEKNKVVEAGAAGIDIEGSDNQVFKNKTILSGTNGIEVGETASPGGATGNEFEKNTSKSSTGIGFRVSDGSNTLDSNKGAKSGTLDLHDDSSSGTNVYDGNKFGTEQVD